MGTLRDEVALMVGPAIRPTQNRVSNACKTETHLDQPRSRTRTGVDRGRAHTPSNATRASGLAGSLALPEAEMTWN